MLMITGRYVGLTLIETLEQVEIMMDCQPMEVFVELVIAARKCPRTEVHYHTLKWGIRRHRRCAVGHRNGTKPVIGHKNPYRFQYIEVA